MLFCCYWVHYVTRHLLVLFDYHVKFDCCFSMMPCALTLFLMFEKKRFSFFFSFSLPCDHMRAKISKRYTPTNGSRKFSNLSWILHPVVPTKVRWGVLKFLIFNVFFFQNKQNNKKSNSPLYMYHEWRNQKPQTSGKRAVVEQNGEIWDSRIVLQHNICRTFGLVVFNVILGSFGAFTILAVLCATA